MRQNPSFLGFLGTLLALAWIVPPALALEGRVRSLDPLELIQRDGSLRQIRPEVGTFLLSDDRRLLILNLTAPLDPLTDCACEELYLGRLNGPLLLEARESSTHLWITVPANRTRVYSSRARLQIEIRGAKGLKIAVESDALTPERNALVRALQEELELKATEIDRLRQNIDQESYREARIRVAGISAHELFEQELQTVKRIFSEVPDRERPLALNLDPEQNDLEVLGEAFPGVSLAPMTSAELAGFIENWARTLHLAPDSPPPPADETRLFSLMEPAGLPSQIQDRILGLALELRVNAFLDLARKGVPLREVPFRDLYVAEIAKSRIRSRETEEARTYWNSVQEKVRKESDPVRAWMREALLDDDL